jgi:hypothetical protein
MLRIIFAHFVQLRTPDVYNERNNSNRYVLTQCDQTMMRELAYILKTEIYR